MATEIEIDKALADMGFSIDVGDLEERPDPDTCRCFFLRDITIGFEGKDCTRRKCFHYGLTTDDPASPEPGLIVGMFHLTTAAASVAEGQTFGEWKQGAYARRHQMRQEMYYTTCRDGYFSLIRLCGRDVYDSLCKLFYLSV
jgi:hypothetical protein